MTDPELTADALRRFRDRALFLCELMTQSPDTAEEDDIPEVLVREVAYLVEEGPAAYCRYVDRLDEAALRAHLDRRPDLVRAQLNCELNRILGRDDA